MLYIGGSGDEILSNNMYFLGLASSECGIAQPGKALELRATVYDMYGFKFLSETEMKGNRRLDLLQNCLKTFMCSCGQP